MKELTPSRFDEVARKRDKLWGARAIADALGVSVDKVYELARDPSVPIFKPAGYFARRSELDTWLRTKSAKA
jgi:hypothetical protein